MGKCKVCGKKTNKHKDMYGGFVCDTCFNKPAEFTIRIQGDLTMNAEQIENRIKAEQRKHPDLDWIKIASIKIAKTIKENRLIKEWI